MNRRRVVAVGAVMLAAGGVGGWQWWARPATATDPDPSDEVSTTPVVRTDLVAREQVPGALGYAGDWRIEHPGPSGVLTAAAAPGSVVRRGQRLYEIDGRPVHLLYGGRPVWREFALGMARGEDVRQLEANLAAMGLRPSTVDTSFTGSTAAAVRRWQARLGRPATGRLPLGSVVFAPEAVRVMEVRPDGPAVRVSSTRRVVAVSLPTARQGQVRPGGPVEVTLPGGRRVRGTIAEVGRVAATPDGAGQPTIAVTVTLAAPDAADGLDQAPVQVTVTTAERRGVLAVPVTALRAALVGGYEVVVVDAAGRRPVPVRPGLLDERAGLIEVTGSGLAEGLRVEVPT